MRRVSRCVSFVVLFLLWATTAHADGTRAFRPHAALTLAELEQVVRERAPSVEAARREVEVAAAEVRQSRLLPNPTFDFEWGTIPLGRTTPPDLERPFANVPNYGVGVGYTFPVKKRAPRRERAEALARAMSAELDDEARALALSLAEALGGLATATLRRAGMMELVTTGKRAVELAEARAKSGFGAALDVDRLRLEVQRSEQALSGIEAEVQEALATCASLTGGPCENFADVESARAYLRRWIELDLPDASGLETRADLRALSAYAEAMRAERRLAEAEALPDPTLRLGYVHDRFIESGNHRNSLNVSVSVPLPLFDRAQGRREAAEASHTHLLRERTKRLSVAASRVPILAARAELERERCERIERQLVPSARAVLENLEAVAENRLISLTEVIQARRTVVELYVEEAESCGGAYRAVVELLRETPPRKE